MTGNLLDYNYFSNHYKLIAIDLSKQIKLRKPWFTTTNFIGKLKEDNGATMFFIIEKPEETNFNFFAKFCECNVKWKHKRS